MISRKKVSFFYLNEVSSTNDAAMALISYFPSGVCIIAEQQFNGRGRHSRGWISPPGKNIYMTLGLNLSSQKKIHVIELSQLTGLVMLETCRKYISGKKQITLKWPNDILANGKKVCGTLIETSYKGENPEFVSIGIGININLTKEDLLNIDKPATSFLVETGKKVNRMKILCSIMEKFEIYYNLWYNQGFDPFHKLWARNVDILGRNIVFYDHGVQKTGKVVDLLPPLSFKIRIENDFFYRSLQEVDIPISS